MAGVTRALFRLVGVQVAHSFTLLPPAPQACTQSAELGKGPAISIYRLLRSVLYPGSKVDFLFESPAPYRKWPGNSVQSTLFLWLDVSPPPPFFPLPNSPFLVGSIATQVDA